MLDKDSETERISIATALKRARACLLTTPQATTAGADAELLLRHVTGLSRATILTHPERRLSGTEIETFYQAVERRAAAEPIQYITGVQEFYGLVFKVTPAVLIPRPETEHLIEAAIEIAGSPAGPLRILDVGTGSGVIAITLAHLLPQALVLATDLSAAALEIARENAASHAVSERIQFLECDLLPPGFGEFDLICSNPPYIANNEILADQVSAFEPHTALFAGAEGLDIYRRLIPLAAASLRPEGWVLMEIGYGQQPAIESLLNASHLYQMRFVPDLQGIARVAVARKGLHGTR